MRDGTSLGSGRARMLGLLGALLGAALVVVACDDEPSDSTPGTGGTSVAGKTGSSGSGSTASGAGGASSSGAGGSSAGAAMGGGAASGGSTAQGGDAGDPGQGGTGGGGGGEAAGAECETSQDCAVLDNCCTCSAVAASASPEACDQVCIQSACSAHGLEGVPAVCEKKRCVFQLSCDRSLVACDAAEPSCPDGTIPSVKGSCWGPCLPPSDCACVTC